MIYSLDPEIAQAATNLLGNAPAPAPPPRGDWWGYREMNTGFYQAVTARRNLHPQVTTEDFTLVTKDASLRLRWYRPAIPATGAAVLYAHGGGMISGSVAFYDPFLSDYVAATGVPFLAVDYRLAPENPGSGPVEEVFAALRWLVEHAAQLGVDPARIAVMGDSAGGGLAAGAAILARDRGVSLARQILVYPMLDDRLQPLHPDIARVSVVSEDFLATCWDALLDGFRENEAVLAVAAPARQRDLARLAPAYVEVGDLDLFRNEDITYALRLAEEGVPVELHVHPSAPHGFDLLAPKAQVARRALEDRCRVLRSL